MLNLINEKGPITLADTLWMLDGTFGVYYADRYDFVRFNKNAKVEFLDGQGDFLCAHQLDIDAKGNYKLKDHPFFKGFEFVAKDKINLVFEGYQKVNDVDMGIQEIRYHLVRLPETIIKLSPDKLADILTQSEWQPIGNTKRSRRQNLKFITWHLLPDEEVKIITRNTLLLRESKETSHLIQIENTILAIKQKLNTINSKAIISSISADEIVLVNHLKNYEEWIFKRVA